MPELSWAAVKQAIYDRAAGCCEYCFTCEVNTGQSMHTEHIQPNGDDSLDNLCLSCANCNLSKASATFAQDPKSGEWVPLFNPRTQHWTDHFIWVEDGIRLMGLTPIGRATIERLKINQERIRVARKRWMLSGHHPPNI